MPKKAASLRNLGYARWGRHRLTAAPWVSSVTAVPNRSQSQRFLGQANEIAEMRGLTETPIILESPMQANDAWMARAKADKGIFLSEGGMEFVVAFEMTLVEHLDRVFLPCCAMCAVYHLLFAACKQGGARGGVRFG